MIKYDFNYFTSYTLLGNLRLGRITFIKKLATIDIHLNKVHMKLRLGNNQDIEFIREMLFEAFFWLPQMSRPDIDEFFNNQEFYKLISDWGRFGDRVVLAENEQNLIGAAWFRLWTESNHSYGYIDSTIPELGIGILSEHRSKGIGRLLLKRIISVAREDGFVALSLSVDPSNFACRLYESEGFVKAGESGTSLTYKLEL